VNKNTILHFTTYAYSNKQHLFCVMVMIMMIIIIIIMIIFLFF